MNSADKIVLSYHETLLRYSDIDLLGGPYWLNDTILSFYFEYLQHETFKTVRKLLFVPPEVTQCIKITPVEEISVFLDPLGSNRKDYIFFALNDNTETEYSGGTHWSLLVFSHPDKACLHFDSSSGVNRSQATDFSAKLMQFFKLPENFYEVECAQQTNGYDCGIFVLLHAEHVASSAISKKRLRELPILKSDLVSVQRGHLMLLIEHLVSGSET